MELFIIGMIVPIFVGGLIHLFYCYNPYDEDQPF